MAAPGGISNGWQVVDTDGLSVSKGLTRTGADALVSSWLDIDVEFGCQLRVVPWEPTESGELSITPANFDLHPTIPINHALNLPNIERGVERDYLRKCIAHHDEAQAAYGSAKEAAARAKKHRVKCDGEVARLQAADETEIAAAGATLADRIKAGEAAPLEPNLKTGRAALLDAEARRDAALEACALLDSELAGAKQHLDTAASNVQKAADVVIRAELMQAVEKLEALWVQTVPLRQLLESARYSGFPPDQRTLKALQPPEFPGRPLLHGCIANYRKALTREAEASLADQPPKVTS
ncbi:hypothetical protein [Paraburkholderia sp. ZP32-5]|uniref:hypothetical protein n=1 Tax=Paraburkholderia sp. ZP32-5 TaxID=2883245 RepID=UPI001F366677|nr:hypothetical protein [Paraburkholderia sp. ZP32-5]